MLLEHVKGITPDAELEAEFNQLTEEVTKLLETMTIIMEGPMDAMADRLTGGEVPNQEIPTSSDEEMPNHELSAPGEVEAGGGMEQVLNAMEQVMKQMDGARRGMGLVNKLGDSASRTRNKSRVMSNMNRIRGNIRRIEKMLASDITEKMDFKSLEKVMDKQSKQGLKDPFGVEKKKSKKSTKKSKK